jgi:hypothetical protein
VIWLLVHEGTWLLAISAASPICASLRQFTISSFCLVLHGPPRSELVITKEGFVQL